MIKIINKINLLYIVIFLILITPKSSLSWYWQKTYGGTNCDYSRSVQQTLDGGYIIAGWTESFGAGGSDVYLIKTDSSGNTEWTNTFGGVLSDAGHSVQQTSDGGYIIAGYTVSFGAGGRDVYLIKTYSDGTTNWTKTFGGINNDHGYSVQQTSDDGYIIAGSTSSFGAGNDDVYLIKTDPLGNTEWTNAFGGGSSDVGMSVQQTSDGGYIIAGYTWSFGAGAQDVYLIKTDPLGNTEWTNTFGGINTDEGYSVQQTSDGGYIIVGRTDSFGAGSYDVYLIKTATNGNIEWTNTFGGINWDTGHSVQQTSDGGYIIAGNTWSFGAGSSDVYLMKTDSSGNISWTNTFGGGSSDVGNSVQQTSDGGYIIVGMTESFGAGAQDVYLIKTDSLGNVEWTNTFGGTGGDVGMSVQQTSDGNYIIAGYTTSFGAGNWDVYLIKYVPLPSASSLITAEAVSMAQINVHWQDVLNETNYILYRNTVNDAVSSVKIAGLKANQLNYNDTGLSSGTTYYYWVQSFNEEGGSGYSVPAYATTYAGPTYTINNVVLIPNPFNPYKSKKDYITFFNCPDDIKIKIYNILSDKLVELKDPNSEHQIIWYGTDSKGNALSRGVYLALLKDSKGNKRTIKFVIQR